MFVIAVSLAKAVCQGFEMRMGVNKSADQVLCLWQGRLVGGIAIAYSLSPCIIQKVV